VIGADRITDAPSVAVRCTIMVLVPIWGPPPSMACPKRDQEMRESCTCGSGKHVAQMVVPCAATAAINAFVAVNAGFVEETSAALQARSRNSSRSFGGLL